MYRTNKLSQTVVLVADDNEINRRFVETVLKRESATVLVAPDGERAVELNRSRVIDLILMDIRMPGMDGETAARIILGESEALSNRPIIIALTAEARPEERDRLLKAGFDNYLTKPVSRDELLGAIEDALSRQPAGKVEDAPAREDLFDRDQALEALGGSEELYEKLLRMFAVELPKYQEQLDVALDDGDYPAAKEHVHKLRSSASYTGAVRFQRIAQDLEEALLRPYPKASEIYERFHLLQDGIASLRRTLERMGHAPQE